MRPSTKTVLFALPLCLSWPLFGSWQHASPCSRLAAQEVARAAATADSAKAQKFILGFRMLDWNTKHMHDAAAASQHADTLRKLGCEVKTAQHNGHLDVQCRTVYWKSLALGSQEQVLQWKAWLELAGFDAIYGRPASSQKAVNADGSHKEVVKYRLADWRSQHIHQEAEIGQLTTLYRSLACEVEHVDHDGHTDLKYRCPQWMEIDLPSHQAAHKWQEFLNKAGFETSHEH